MKNIAFNLSFFLLTILILANIITVYVDCGFGACAG